LTSCLLTAFMGVACRPAERGESGQESQPALSQEAAAEARRTIVRWLECEECTEGQLDAVVKLGELAVATLTATLLEGPSPVRVDEHRQYLRDLYRQKVQYARTHPRAAPKLSEAEHTALYTENLLARYRSRSAIALQRIGGPAAAEALQKAVKLQLRKDTRGVVESAATRVQP
jgi:hypothetical protein